MSGEAISFTHQIPVFLKFIRCQVYPHNIIHPKCLFLPRPNRGALLFCQGYKKVIKKPACRQAGISTNNGSEMSSFIYSLSYMDENCLYNLFCLYDISHPALFVVSATPQMVSFPFAPSFFQSRINLLNHPISSISFNLVSICFTQSPNQSLPAGRQESLNRSLAPSFLRSLVLSFHRSFVPSFPRSIAPSFLRSIAPSFHRSFVPSFHRSIAPSFYRSILISTSNSPVLLSLSCV